ncbi:ROK family protein [Aneurinibacillus terranovensis]|uniref:ROK family protein n=1 Tax=Aneurinibacillus terranovensis TaxID=278991 RepID=UPI000400B850|nr:ROK family protein [Aneurinibacillus terranovensis]
MIDRNHGTLLSIGVDLGGTNVRIALIDGNGTIIREIHAKTEANQGPDYVIAHIIEMIKQVKSEHTIRGIGIGAPGPLDPFKGVILDPPNLSGWNHVPLTSLIEREFAVPVVLNNDANAAALAEAISGAGIGYKSVLYITVSTGIGAGIVVDGKLVMGEQGNAGEIGNMIILPGGPKQSNLNAGALEAVASGTAIAREGSKRLGTEVDAAGVFQMAKNGHKEAEKIIDEAMTYLAMGIANLIHVLNPSLVVLGGGVMKSKEFILPIIREKTTEYLYPSLQPFLKIEPAKLGTKAGVIGAGLLPE